MNTYPFTVTVHDFNGPLELLLQLIEHKKMNISEVALACVADEYVQYIQQRQSVPLQQTTQFVVVAATLLLIKSQSLLPDLVLSQAEENDVHELKTRLATYIHVRRSARILKTRWHKRAYTPKRIVSRPIVFAPATDISLPNIYQHAQSLAQSFAVFKEPPTARVAPEIMLKDVVKELAHRITLQTHTSFKQITCHANRIESIVHFLALLELVKTDSCEARQDDYFSDIRINTQEITTPHYE